MPSHDSDDSAMNLAARLRSIDRKGDRFWPRDKGRAPGEGPRTREARDIPPLRTIETFRGPAYVREVSIPLSRRHGSRCVGDFRWIEPRGLALLARDSAFGKTRPEEALFLDVETTGLMSGAGLLIFLVGLGYISDDRFVVEQHFLRDPGGEQAFLEAILDRWGRCKGIITFNGRQFDGPRLLDRLRFQRLDTAPPDGYHLDLFVLARRVWRGVFPSLALQDLEVRLLGHVREDDLPGALCPAAYAAYLRGEEGRIGDVFRHNLEDILSLATLAVRLDRVARSPKGPFEKAALAMALHDAGKERSALVLFESALRDLPAGSVTTRHRRAAAAAYRRGGDHDRAVEIWRGLWGEGDLRSARSLAIALEHRHRRFRAAERVARQVVEVLERQQGAPTRTRRDWEKRLARIRRKRESSRGGPNGEK